MSNYVKDSDLYLFAKSELDMILKNRKDDDHESYMLQKVINQHILKIVELFCKGQYSGFSAGYVINILEHLLEYMPLSPLSGNDYEWKDVSDLIPNTEQNKRCSKVFRHNHDNSTAYMINAKYFTDDYISWFTTEESVIPVTFPFIVPKAEYIRLGKEKE